MLYPLSYGGGPGREPSARRAPGTDARVMAHAEIHRDRRIDAADLAALSGRTLAVIGFGNQGAAQAANLRDSGFAPLVGNRDDEYATSAAEEGFDLRPIAEAAAAADIALLLVPDEEQPELVRRRGRARACARATRSSSPAATTGTSACSRCPRASTSSWSRRA